MAAASEDTTSKLLGPIAVALIAAGVAGLWSMSATMVRLEERVVALIVDMRDIKGDVKSVSERIRMLERENEPGPPPRRYPTPAQRSAIIPPQPSNDIDTNK